MNFLIFQEKDKFWCLHSQYDSYDQALIEFGNLKRNNPNERYSMSGRILTKDTSRFQPASTFLKKAASLIEERGKERDKPNGERSMDRCVNAFNAMTGHNLTEVDGWLFMQYLKHARSYGGKFRLDDYEDDIAYAALKAEAAAKNERK